MYGFLFRSLAYDTAFIIMGIIVICSSFLSLFINIPCHAGLVWGEDNFAVIQARERYLERVERARMQHLEPNLAGGSQTVHTERQEQESNNIKPVDRGGVEVPESVVVTKEDVDASSDEEEGVKQEVGDTSTE